MRDKIVADGITDPTFSMENKGKYVNAVQMNELLQKPGTIVIDMRNHYETEIGHFEGAITPDVDTFIRHISKGKQPETITCYRKRGTDFYKVIAHNLPEDTL